MSDIAQKLYNAKLVKAIKAFNNNSSAATLKTLSFELNNSKLYVPIAEPSFSITDLKKIHEGSKITLEEEKGILFQIIMDDHDNQYYFAFTDIKELTKHNDNYQTIVLSFEDIASYLLQNNRGIDAVIINPFGSSIAVTKDFILLLKDIREQNYSVVEIEKKFFKE